ncbi:MAG: protoheme IX farnesyltransferase [Chloroflexi bacterium]|nr:protoheme IX farnesyltransferase [Chloroflexota bacterium]
MNIPQRVKAYWQLTKSLQTGLLMLTGVAGYLSAHPGMYGPLYEIFVLLATLYLTIAGSTVLNMWYDRDIDARMQRTCWRPLPSGQISPTEALILGLAMVTAGVVWAAAIAPLYGLVLFAGAFFDVVVYTMWLKRRTPWSILWGGISGAMPALAGRVLGVGRIDLVGILLALAVLFWIPTHIVTFAMRYDEDYRRAGVPTIPRAYGFRFAYGVIAVAAILASAAMLSAAWLIGVRAGAFQALLVLSVALLFLALTSALRPSPRLNFALFKFASFYMLGGMLLIAWGA